MISIFWLQQLFLHLKSPKMSVLGSKNMGLWTPESKNGELNTSSMGCRSCVMLCGEKWILQKYFGQVLKKNYGYLFLILCDIWIIMREVPIVTPGSPDVMSQRLLAMSSLLLGYIPVHLVKYFRHQGF